jgi:hypothetical protein
MSTSTRTGPTPRTYSSLDAAYRHFNHDLFGGAVWHAKPACRRRAVPARESSTRGEHDCHE